MEVQQQRPVLSPASQAHATSRLLQQQDFVASLEASQEGVVAVVPPLLCLSQNPHCSEQRPLPWVCGDLHTV